VGPGGTADGSAPGAEHEHGGEGEEDDGAIDDGFEPAHDPSLSPQGQPSASIKLSDQEIEERLRDDPASLGPMSVGTTNAGALVNGVQMPKGEHWDVIDPSLAWGTRETVDYLTRSIQKVHAEFPGSQPLFIGHISARRGGRLSPHVSHQAGRDVDISYYMRTTRRGFYRAHSDNLDAARTWAFVKALITETDVEMILIDTSIQRLLEEYASGHGEDEGWLDQIFQVRGKSRRPVIRHAKGHVNHIHIRFYNPVAQEMGRRAHPALASRGEVRAESFVMHKARKGDTLGSLANRYGTTVDAIRQANGLRSNFIQAKHVYRIPKKGRVVPPGPLVLPPRTLPPSKGAATAPSAPSAAEPLSVRTALPNEP
jgi:penicillin-insensitive murein endopeptidase